jgi:hypothetical protein
VNPNHSDLIDSLELVDKGPPSGFAADSSTRAAAEMGMLEAFKREEAKTGRALPTRRAGLRSWRPFTMMGSTPRRKRAW